MLNQSSCKIFGSNFSGLALSLLLCSLLRVRLHSASSFRALAVLQYHKDSVYSLAFGHQISHDPHEEAGVDEKESDSSSDEDESTDAEHVERERWLACGGKDGRISLWNLPFSASY